MIVYNTSSFSDWRFEHAYQPFNSQVGGCSIVNFDSYVIPFELTGSFLSGSLRNVRYGTPSDYDANFRDL
jgi:hypothetical protein